VYFAMKKKPPNKITYYLPYIMETYYSFLL
jgi:hypothetical protein